MNVPLNPAFEALKLFDLGFEAEDEEPGL